MVAAVFTKFGLIGLLLVQQHKYHKYAYKLYIYTAKLL